MSWQVLDPRIPYILVSYAATGGAQVADQRSGESVFCPDEACLFKFAADRSGGPYALGNIVHRALAAAGFHRCLPCAKRQLEMNVAPRGWWQRMFG
jgi:hypothetical protein